MDDQITFCKYSTIDGKYHIVFFLDNNCTGYVKDIMDDALRLLDDCPGGIETIIDDYIKWKKFDYSPDSIPLINEENISEKCEKIQLKET